MTSSRQILMKNLEEILDDGRAPMMYSMDHVSPVFEGNPQHHVDLQERPSAMWDCSV